MARDTAPEPAETWPPDPLALTIKPPEWLTIEQAAAVANVNDKTMRRWVRRHPIAVRMPSGKWWVNRARLFAFTR